MNKDVYAVIKNPKNPLLPYEIWIKGQEKYISTEDGSTKSRMIVKKLDSFRTEQKAKSVIHYWQNLQDFKQESA